MYCHLIERIWTGYGSAIGFIEVLQLVTTSKDYAFTVLHTSQITIGHIRSPQSVTVFTSRCLPVASKGGRSLSSVFLNLSSGEKIPGSFIMTTSQLMLLICDFLANTNTTVLPQPSYSPDLAPADFFLFLKLKSTLKG
jgi:hypothetical protein